MQMAEHRTISLRHILRSMGARPLPARRIANEQLGAIPTSDAEARAGEAVRLALCAPVPASQKTAASGCVPQSERAGGVVGQDSATGGRVGPSDLAFRTKRGRGEASQDNVAVVRLDEREPDLVLLGVLQIMQLAKGCLQDVNLFAEK